MSLPEVTSREQWLEARRRLLAQEKELTHHHDALNASRRRLPMVKVERDYVFEGPAGPVTLAELFGDKRQYGYERDLRVHPARDRPRDRLAADPQARARRLDRVVTGRVVVRR